MQDLPVWFEVGSLTLMVVIIIADLLLVIKRPHVPSNKEALLWVSFYVSLAIAFGISLLFMGNPNGELDYEHSAQFFAGWLTEYSLSLDNLFVFVIIMSRFKVPRKLQQEVLMVGIIIALILRAIFIILGAQVLEAFSWVFYIFGAFLVYTAIKQVVPEKEEEEPKENILVRTLRKRVNVTNEFHENKLSTVIDGKRHLTPMLMVFIAIGMTDLLFALDSIPAIFGITTNPFLVFSTNLFALMGLRQLYFLLEGMLQKLEYLHYGIAAILIFIGFKLVFHAMHVNELPFINGGQPIEWAPEISTTTSLIVIISSIAIAIFASLIKSRFSSSKEA